MTGLVMKIIVCPVVVYLASLWSAQVNYASVYQPLVVGLVLALTGHVMESQLLNQKTVWITTGLDFIAATVLLYLSGIVFVGASVTFMGALITGLVLAVTELIQHYYLVGTEKVEH